MKILKKTAAAVVCAAIMALNMSACKAENQNADGESGADSDYAYSSDSENIKIKTYEFPEFLSSLGDADVLSNPVYKSFDSSKVLAEPEKQPFDGYKCTGCFNDEFYIFKDGDNYGLLDSNGTVAVDSQDVKKISAVSADLLQIRYTDGTTSYVRASNGTVSEESVAEFDPSRISFEAKPSDADETQNCYALQIDGEEVYDGEWLSVEPVDIADIDTAHTCEAAYKVTSGSGSWYITFDILYNFTVYEAAYGFVSLKIGGEYGECYITDSDDYAELDTLLSSFGSETRVKSPTKDENADFIELVFGVDGGDKKTVTISSDGYCLTVTEPADGSAGNRFFTVMSAETFVDLVNWVDSVLGAEYGN